MEPFQGSGSARLVTRWRATSSEIASGATEQIEDLDEIVRSQGLRLVRLDDEFVASTRNPTSRPLGRSWRR